MPADPRSRLLRDGRRVPLPAGELEDAIATFEQLGIIATRRCRFVECARAGDRDYHRVRAQACGGRAYLDSGLDEHGGELCCTECGRVVYASGKQVFEELQVNTVPAGMTAYVHGLLQGLAGTHIEVDMPGVVRVTGSQRVEVCVVDACADRRLLERTYSELDQLVYVVGDRNRLAPRLPAGVPPFGLADLVMDSSTVTQLRRLVRMLAGADRGDDIRPAALLPPRAGGLDLSQSRPAHPKPPIVHVPPGTRWGDIHIFYVDGDTLSIRVPGALACPYSASDLGMVRRDNKRATHRFLLLGLLCKERGQVGGERQSTKRYDALRQRVKELNKDMKSAFGIFDVDPVKCSRTGGASASFRAYPDPPGREGEEERLRRQARERGEDP